MSSFDSVNPIHIKSDKNDVLGKNKNVDGGTFPFVQITLSRLDLILLFCVVVLHTDQL